MKVGICGLMFLIMFALKLAGPMAAVSWWIITLPIYLPVLIILGMFAFVGIVAAASSKGWK